MKDYSSEIGKKYGSLTIINIKRNENNDAMAICECDCGVKDKVFYIQSLIHGKTKTCHTNEHKLYLLKKDNIGKKYGLLTIKDFEFKDCRTGKNICHAICDCDCGTKNYSCIFTLLKHGQPTSCGCLVHKTMAQNKGYKDLTGKKFGFWTVLYNTGKKDMSKNYYYMCECSCNARTKRIIKSTNLIQGHCTNCGCLNTNGTSLKSLKSRVSGTVNKNNSSGINGVYWNIKAKKWISTLCFQRTRIHLGVFNTRGEAYIARKQAEEQYYLPLLEKKYSVEEVKQMIKKERSKEIKPKIIRYSDITGINTMDIEIAKDLNSIIGEEV